MFHRITDAIKDTRKNDLQMYFDFNRIAHLGDGLSDYVYSSLILFFYFLIGSDRLQNMYVLGQYGILYKLAESCDMIFRICWSEVKSLRCIVYFIY